MRVIEKWDVPPKIKEIFETYERSIPLLLSHIDSLNIKNSKIMYFDQEDEDYSQKSKLIDEHYFTEYYTENIRKERFQQNIPVDFKIPEHIENQIDSRPLNSIPTHYQQPPART